MLSSIQYFSLPREGVSTSLHHFIGWQHLEYDLMPRLSLISGNPKAPGEGPEVMMTHPTGSPSLFGSSSELGDLFEAISSFWSAPAWINTTVITTPERRSNIGRQPSWDNDGKDRLYFNCWHVSSHLLPNDIYTAERSTLVSCSFCTGVGAILKRRVLNGMHMFYNIQNELLILRSLSL